MRRSNRYYKDLKQRLKQHQFQPDSSRVKDELGRVLDDLNAWGFLEEQVQAHHTSITCYGPRIVRGFLPVTWAGVVLWYKRRGYYFYDRLFLLGLWAQREVSEEVQVVLGLRELNYDLPFFNPESYYRRLQEDFQIYYKDNGAPPPLDQSLYHACYVPERRLDIRREIEDELIVWAAALKRSW